MIQYYSPLRYPGGKAKISNYIKLIITENYLEDGVYVEPYAGGASVALELVINEYVSKVLINDIDRMIYAFWDAVLFNAEKLCKKIRDTKVTIAQWKRQKKIQKNIDDYTNFELAFATFFLNRTNRSGILNAGVIGGKNQDGDWKLDARYNKENLISRIELIAQYSDRIILSNMDAIPFIGQVQKTIKDKALIYLDPPYYNKGKQLYINFYEHQDHLEIAELISKIDKGNWIISYDDTIEIKKMYSNYRQQIYSLSYSAAQASKGSEVIVYDDKLKIPKIINPTDKSEIKEYYAQNYV